MMGLYNYYEDITESEADFIIDLYNCISKLVRDGRPVTLVGLAYELGIRAISGTIRLR